MLFKYELKIIVQTEAKNTWMILYKLIYNPLAGTRVTSPLLKWWSNCLKKIWVKQKLKWPIDLSKWDFSQFSSDQIHVFWLCMRHFTYCNCSKELRGVLGANWAQIGFSLELNSSHCVLALTHQRLFPVQHQYSVLLFASHLVVTK